MRLMSSPIERISSDDLNWKNLISGISARKEVKIDFMHWVTGSTTHHGFPLPVIACIA